MGLIKSKQESLNARLFKAVDKNFQMEAFKLIEQGAAPNAIDPKTKLTPLLTAICSKTCNTVMINMLLRAGADANLGGGDDNRPPLLDAITYDCPDDIFKVLVNGGADASKGTYLALHHALQLGRISILPILFDGKAVVTASNTQGNTALHVAAVTGRLDAVKYLISKGADIFAKNNKYETAADIARADHLGIAKYLDEQMALQTKPVMTEPTKKWVKTAKDEVAVVMDRPAINYRLTHIFNFTMRTCTHIARNMGSGNESLSFTPFDHFADTSLLRTAWAHLQEQGGDAPPPEEITGPHRIDKPKPPVKG